MTAGASLNPDSASSRPATRRGNGSTRRTENTAAASVEDTMAPSSSANCQSMSSRTCAPAAVIAVLMRTPTVARTPAGASTLRTSANRVVNPPSTRITASATVPMLRASSTLSNSRPNPSSPMTTPTSRYSSRLGKPTRVATRVPTMLASSTKPPTSNARYSCSKLISFPPSARVLPVKQCDVVGGPSCPTSMSQDGSVKEAAAAGCDRRCRQGRPIRRAGTAGQRPQGPADRTPARALRTRLGSRRRLVDRRRLRAGVIGGSRRADVRRPDGSHR